MPRPEAKITLQVLMQGPDTLRVTPFKEGSVLESTVKTSRTCPFERALVADRAREILSLLQRANAGEKGLLPLLVKAGQAIYLDLLPAFLKEKLEEASARNLALHLDRPLLGIPWELLHDGDEFLGRRFRIGRLVSLENEPAPPLQRAMRAPLSVLIVADPTGDLPAARREADELSVQLEDCPAFRDVTMLTGEVGLRKFRDEFARHDALHFAGHATGGDPRGGRLRLHDGELTSQMVEQLRGRVDLPGLVVLNACGSSDEAMRLSSGADPLAGATGLAGALLLGGVRHVVGTLWEVRDEVARLAARGLWGALGQGATIGASLAAVREQLIAGFGEDSLLWADYLLYGDPTWRVEQAAHAEFEDFDVLEGLQAKYRQELRSVDPGTRLMAAAMLLRLGERDCIHAIARELPTLLAWFGAAAPQRERRRAALVLQALAAAAGVSPSEAPDEMPDPQAVRALLVRLGAADPGAA